MKQARQDHKLGAVGPVDYGGGDMNAKWKRTRKIEESERQVTVHRLGLLLVS